MSGWYSLARDWADNPVFDKEPFCKRMAWVWMIERACWKPTRFNIQGKTIMLERGQFCASIRQLADEWGWSKSSVQRFITRLQTDTMIGTQSGTGKMIVTVCNYSKYQSEVEKCGTLSGTTSGTGAGQERDTKEQGNKGTREEDRDNLDSIGVNARDISKKNVSKPKPKIIPLPNDWQPEPFGAGTKSAKIVDGWPPGHIAEQVQLFADHHKARGNAWSDWQAAWRTWVTRSEKFRRERQNGSATHIARRSNGGQPVGNAWLRAAVDAAHGQPAERGPDP